MIKLAKLLTEHNITSALFINSFQEMHKVKLSKGSFSLLLSEGRQLKKMPSFKDKIAKTFEVLTNLRVTEKILFEKILEDTMIESQNLSYETLKHFGLTKDPFLPFITKESDIVMLPSHQFALEMMRASRDTGQFTVVTSEVGGGKTTILGKFESETNTLSEFITIKVRTRDMDRCTARDILTACVYDLSDEKPKRGPEALTRQVESLLKKSYKSGRRAILIIDEAQDLHTNTLKYLKRLWELRDGLTPLLGIILIGQTELATRLYYQNNLNIREVTSRTIHAPLEAINDDLEKYITGKLKCIKGDISKLITSEAITTLSNKLVIVDRNGKRINKAYPLEIGNRLKRLMNLAYEQGVRIIDTKFINEAGL